MPATPSDLQAVLVIGNQIAEIGVAGSVPAPRGTLVVDGRGQTLMPGLIDAHVHLNDETELAAYLAHGVTGLRNMSGYPFHLRLIERIAQQQLIAPDLITTGAIINSSGPNELVLQTTVTTADEARAVVRKQHRAGYRANLILVPSDPLNDISVLEFPAGVMINGVWLDQHALDELKASARGSNTITFLRSLIRVIEMKLYT